MSQIIENLEKVERNIEEACNESGRKRDEVTLIAVSKTKPVEDIREAMKCGIKIFGENKVQELREKTEIIKESLEWHMIGHLQTNKVKYLPGMVYMIHSVDNLPLANEIEKQYRKHNMIAKILCEVNMAHEDTKYGLAPEDTLDFIKQIKDLTHIQIEGLMTIAPATEYPEDNRQFFSQLRQLEEKINIELKMNMKELSMGMTGDYRIAIDEGATFVRVGTGIFGARNYANVNT